MKRTIQYRGTTYRLYAKHAENGLAVYVSMNPLSDTPPILGTAKGWAPFGVTKGQVVDRMSDPEGWVYENGLPVTDITTGT